MEKHILIIEDESSIASALALRLQNEGFLVAVADNGKDGLDLAINEDYDLAIIDVMLPEINGLEITSQLRKNKNTAILILSALSHESDIISGLVNGADDYVTKPFSLREIVARVHALLRRNSTLSNTTNKQDIRYGELTIHTRSHSITLNDDYVHTTPTEFRILHILASQPDVVFTREEIVKLIDTNRLEANTGVDTHSNQLRTIDSHIRSLRKKVGQQYIRTIHGVGYSFNTAYSETQKSA